jgi:signal transduction histidine kinase
LPSSTTSAAPGTCSLSLNDFLHSTSFRLTTTIAALFCVATFALFGLIYYQTAGFEARRVAALVTEDVQTAVDAQDPDSSQLISTRVSDDFHHMVLIGVFEDNGRRISGDLSKLPAGVPVDGKAHVAEVTSLDHSLRLTETARVVEQDLPDGRILAVVRYSGEVERLRREVSNALELGLIPTFMLSLLIGILVTWRIQLRVIEVNRVTSRFMQGELTARLPIRGSNDDLDRLSMSVNRMLGEIEHLVDELKVTGDEIAHDLRTPLTRVKARLENVMQKGTAVAHFRDAIEKSIIGLDQTFSIVSALLRIREIEAGRRRSEFREIRLDEILQALDELYQPLAEQRNVVLTLRPLLPTFVVGDRELLTEAIGNLLDNALKFTPEHGTVDVSLTQQGGRTLIRISDSGPGIAPAEREAVFNRFYRSSATKHVPGVGLGLSLVGAIARLHGIRISLHDDAPGFSVKLAFGGRLDGELSPGSSYHKLGSASPV